MNYEFLEQPHGHAITHLLAPLLSKKVTLQSMRGDVVRLLEIDKNSVAEFIDLLTTIKEAFTDEKAPSTEGTSGKIRAAIHNCPVTATKVIGLWILKKWQEDSDVTPLITVPHQLVAELQKALRASVPHLSDEFGSSRIVDLPAGAVSKFRILISMSIVEGRESNERWLRLEQAYGPALEKAAVFYIPEKYVNEVWQIARTVVSTNEKVTVGGMEVGRQNARPNTQITFGYFFNSGLREMVPKDATKECVRIPDKAIGIVADAAQEMIGRGR